MRISTNELVFCCYQNISFDQIDEDSISDDVDFVSFSSIKHPSGDVEATVFEIKEKSDNEVLLDFPGSFLNEKKKRLKVCSSVLTERCVFLYCIYDGKQVIVVQHLNSLLSVYFPSNGVLYYFFRSESVNRSFFKEFLIFLVKNYSSVKEYIGIKKKPLGGFVVSTDPRPSHFFYEFFPGIMVRRDFIRKSPELELLYRLGTNFVSLANVFSLPNSEFVLERRKYQNIPIDASKIYVQPCLGKLGYHKKYLPEVDKLLITSSFKNCGRKIHSELYAEETKSLPASEVMEDSSRMLSFCEGGRPVVWFSVLSEEKNWVEQNSTIVNIIKRFMRFGYRPLVLFDGMTSCDSFQSFSDFDTRGEVREIVDGVGEGFDFVDMNGMKANEKVIYALFSSIFLTSVGTDSFYPSRVAGKPGVVHSSPRLDMFKKHVYSDLTIKSDPAKSFYISSQESLREDKRSYSISSEYIESLFWECWERVFKAPLER